MEPHLFPLSLSLSLPPSLPPSLLLLPYTYTHTVHKQARRLERRETTEGERREKPTMEPAPGARAPRGGAASTAAEAGLSSSSAASSSQAEQGGQRQPQQPGGGGHEAAQEQPQPLSQQPPAGLSRYESQKRRDWNTFLQYLRNHKPPLTLARCSGAHVIEFLKYLDQFGKTKVHADGCAYFGQPNPPAPCACPLRQAWGSLDALIGRLRAAYEESGGRPESNPFAARPVRIYLREVREAQAKARGIPYEKKKRKRGSTAAAPAAPPPVITAEAAGTSGGGEEEDEPSPSTEQQQTTPVSLTPPPPRSSSAGASTVAAATTTGKEPAEGSAPSS